MADTEISWTDKVWNPVRGCSRVSPGCDHCYAMGQAHRFSGEGGAYEGLTVLRPKTAKRPGVDWAGRARLAPDKLGEPLRWRKPQRIFVNSMSDLFHESLSNAEIAAVFGVMAATKHHTFQVLTKRPARAREWFHWLETEGVDEGSGRWCSRAEACRREALEHFPRAADGSVPPELHERRALMGYDGRWPLPNVHLGVSVERQREADDRISVLLELPAAVRFISAEPLLEYVTLWAFLKGEVRDQSLAILGGAPLPGLDWVIVGGESGTGARPFDLAWAESIVQQCRSAEVACFVKQLGAKPYRSVSAATEGMGGVGLALKDKKGGDMSEWPEALRIRQFPEVSRV